MTRQLLNSLIAFGLVAASAATPGSVEAQISVKFDKPFKHQPSGIEIAPLAGGIPRASVVQFDDKQLDVAVDFHTPDNTEVTTLYIFRNVTGDVPVWFDRIQRTVESSDRLGKVTPAIPVAAFIPAGQNNARALRAAYSVTGNGWTSSAAALTATGEWYVAIRSSSKTLTPQQLLARIDQTFAAIHWPAEAAATPVAVAINDCAKPLVQGPDAGLAIQDKAWAVASIIGATADIVRGTGQKPVILWCRDPAKVERASVYRPNGATDRYLIALQDAGRGLIVGANDHVNKIASELNREPLFSVELVELDRHSGLGNFRTLPNVAQALRAAEHNAWMFRVPTWGKDRRIEVNSDVLK